MENKRFDFRYTAPTEEERRGIERIRRQYYAQEKQETKLERLYALDAKVKRLPLIWSLTFGIGGCLVFGVGLTMVLEWALAVYGIAVMLAGGVAMAAAYPVYHRLLTGNRKKYGEEILRLSDELLNGNTEQH